MVRLLLLRGEPLGIPCPRDLQAVVVRADPRSLQAGCHNLIERALVPGPGGLPGLLTGGRVDACGALRPERSPGRVGRPSHGQPARGLGELTGAASKPSGMAGLVGDSCPLGPGLAGPDDLDGLACRHGAGAEADRLLTLARGEVVMPVRRR